MRHIFDGSNSLQPGNIRHRPDTLLISQPVNQSIRVTITEQHNQRRIQLPDNN